MSPKHWGIFQRTNMTFNVKVPAKHLLKLEAATKKIAGVMLIHVEARGNTLPWPLVTPIEFGWVISTSEKGQAWKAKGNFPLAECNELSRKCFSHTPLGAWV